MTVFLFIGLTIWGPQRILIIQTFQPLILIYRRGTFVYHHWGCTSIYRPLSFPFRSLQTERHHSTLYHRSMQSIPVIFLTEANLPWFLSVLINLWRSSGLVLQPWTDVLQDYSFVIPRIVIYRIKYYRQLSADIKMKNYKKPLTSRY